MGTTLQNGLYLPNEGEKNCYAGLKLNWETLDAKIADITALQEAVAGALHREIVATLPTTDIDTATIYMILNGTSATENVYNEFMYVNNAWELIGTSATDLTNYYTKAEVDGKLLLKANASDLNSHTGDTTIHVTASDKAKWNTVALIKQLRLVNTQVGSATTIPFSNFDDTNGIKVGDKCMDLDGKMFEITAVDTTNQTVTVGSALIDLALDAKVMHLSGNETVDGQKTFSGGMALNNWLNFTNSLVTKGTIPQSTLNPYRIYFGSGVNYGASLFNIDTSVSNTGVQSFIFRSAENVVSGDDARFVLIYDPNRTQPRYLSVKGGIEPNANNTYECGTNSNKWKSFNGLNPGSLSLPDLNNGIDISGYITLNSDSSYTPLSDGYVYICCYSSAACGLWVRDTNNNGISTRSIGSVPTYNNLVSICIPVVKNVSLSIFTPGCENILTAKFFPCQGNV